MLYNTKYHWGVILAHPDIFVRPMEVLLENHYEVFSLLLHTECTVWVRFGELLSLSFIE